MEGGMKVGMVLTYPSAHVGCRRSARSCDLAPSCTNHRLTAMFSSSAPTWETTACVHSAGMKSASPGPTVQIVA